MNNSIYQVNREDYKSFIEQIIPGCGETKQESAGIYLFTYLYSKKTGKKLCGRRSFIGENSHKKEPELYYIYEMPDNDERREPIPKMKLVLNSKEEVQAFFDALSKANKENKNDRNI